jgi:hypothetical protein
MMHIQEKEFRDDDEEGTSPAGPVPPVEDE